MVCMLHTRREDPSCVEAISKLAMINEYHLDNIKEAERLYRRCACFGLENGSRAARCSAARGSAGCAC
jgi:hypothetical protein